MNLNDLDSLLNVDFEGMRKSAQQRERLKAIALERSERAAPLREQEVKRRLTTPIEAKGRLLDIVV